MKVTILKKGDVLLAQKGFNESDLEEKLQAAGIDVSEIGRAHV